MNRFLKMASEDEQKSIAPAVGLLGGIGAYATGSVGARYGGNIGERKAESQALAKIREEAKGTYLAHFDDEYLKDGPRYRDRLAHGRTVGAINGRLVGTTAGALLASGAYGATKWHEGQNKQASADRNVERYNIDTDSLSLASNGGALVGGALGLQRNVPLGLAGAAAGYVVGSAAHGATRAIKNNLSADGQRAQGTEIPKQASEEEQSKAPLALGLTGAAAGGAIGTAKGMKTGGRVGGNRAFDRAEPGIYNSLEHGVYAEHAPELFKANKDLTQSRQQAGMAEQLFKSDPNDPLHVEFKKNTGQMVDINKQIRDTRMEMLDNQLNPANIKTKPEYLEGLQKAHGQGAARGKRIGGAVGALAGAGALGASAFGAGKALQGRNKEASAVDQFLSKVANLGTQGDYDEWDLSRLELEDEEKYLASLKNTNPEAYEERLADVDFQLDELRRRVYKSPDSQEMLARYRNEGSNQTLGREQPVGRRVNGVIDNFMNKYFPKQANDLSELGRAYDEKSEAYRAAMEEYKRHPDGQKERGAGIALLVGGGAAAGALGAHKLTGGHGRRIGAALGGAAGMTGLVTVANPAINRHLEKKSPGREEAQRNLGAAYHDVVEAEDQYWAQKGYEQSH